MVDDAEILTAQKNTLLEISTMPDKNKIVITEFLRKLKNDGLSLRSQINYVNTLILFCRKIQTEFRELSSTDIYQFLDHLDECKYTSKSGNEKSYSDATKNSHKVLLRSFLKYLLTKDKETKFLKHLGKDDIEEMIKTKNMTNDKLPEDLLTPEEVKKLVSIADEPRDKALIATLYESGARKGEMLACDIKHVVFDDNGCVLTFPSGKTGARRVRLVYSSTYLLAWLENKHSLRNQKDAPLWITLRKPYNRLAMTTFDLVLKKAAKAAGLEKKVNPHEWRHARATELAGELTEHQLCTYLGWVIGSNMPSTYVHMSGRDIDEAILRLNGIEIVGKKKETLMSGRCPRCKSITTDMIYCAKCGLPLTTEAGNKLSSDMSDVVQKAWEVSKQDRDFDAELSAMLQKRK